MSKPHLPADMRRLLLDQPGPLCTSAIINEQAAIIVKAERATCEGLRGPIPIGYRAELGMYPSGAAIRLAIDFFDHPDDPLSMDTFLNVAQADHLRLLRVLAAQPVIVIHLFDEAIDYVISKVINHRGASRSELDTLIEMARQHNTTIARVDWPTAKAAMMKDRPI